ncbi:MAG: chromosome segregation protein SMC [Bacillota bacterium]
MYLKSLEIHGFKSFADKTVMEFEPGITCIVGPNGSGKSNVCDAIRWVLGEQNIRTLRGVKLEDIIFSGSENRRPLGMANVSLLFDNTSGVLPLEFNEVSIGRRVYRSGESEFLINKAPCRLKDIQELFHDTGVGKEAFAIIGQGQVDAILSSRPEERRSLFEEAAGIVRYRNRKTDATRKLEATQVNLDRLQDLLYELGQNLDPLKEEAERTKLYGTLVEELQKLELSLICLDLTKMETQQQNIFNKEKELADSLLEKESKLSLVRAKWSEVQFVKEKVEEQERQCQQQIFSLQGEIQKNESETRLLNDRIDTIAERSGAIIKEIETYRNKIKELEESYGGEQKQLENLVAINYPLEEQVRSNEEKLANYQLETEELQKKGEHLKNLLFDLEQGLASFRNQQVEMQFELKSLARQKADLERVKKEHQAHKDKLVTELTGIEREQLDNSSLKEKYRQEYDQKEAAKELAVEQLKKLEQEKGEIQKKCYAALSKLKVLQEMREEFEGYQFGVSSLLKNAKNSEAIKIIGVVGEMLKVPGQYEKAIEMALGSALQFLVVENEEYAKRAIEWLKAQKAGRATFLPLPSLQPRKLSKEMYSLLGQPGVLGLGTDLVGIEDNMQKVLDYLLGSIVVVTDLAAGAALAKQSKFTLKIVTLDGDIFFPGGSLTGGSSKRSANNILGRTREIKEEKKKLQSLEEQEKSISEKILLLKEKFKFLEADQEKIKTELYALDLLLQNQKLMKEKIMEDLSKEKNLLGYRLLEAKQSSAREKVIQSEILELGNLYRQEEAKKENIAKQINYYKEGREAVTGKIIDLENQLLQEKIKLASQQEKQKSLENFLVYYNQNKVDLVNNLARLEGELKELEARKIAIVNELSALKKTEVLLLEKERKMVKTKRQLEAEKAAALAKFQTLEQELKNGESNLEAVRKEHYQFDMQKTRFELEFSNGLEKLWEKFQLTLEQAKEKIEPITSRRSASERVRELKGQIADLGTINPLAIEEFKRQQERFQFLSLQQQDLLKAKDGLYQIIAEMDKIMKQRFLETFKQVEVAFQEVFAYLFEGGKTSLELTDKEAVLESGIEIIAQPPGKKMQNLSLLSGGERALTAIALLFALLKIKPSPFCVLDEIDANLDETNVDRFANYLKEFVTETQFILISHRQGTMEIADALYGVTMEELGISRLLSVKMNPSKEVC